MSETQKYRTKIVKLFVFKSDDEITDNLKEKISHNLAEYLTNSKKDLFNIYLKKRDDFHILRLDTEHEQEVDVNIFHREDSGYHDLLANLQDALPSEPYTIFTILIIPSENQGKAELIIRDYSDKLSLSVESINRLGDLTVSSLDTFEGDITKQYYLLSPHISTEYKISEPLMIIEQLAFHTAELIEVENHSRNLFSVLDVGEGEIGERVEGYLWKLLGLERVELETLESWLSYIMERENTLSAMIGNMEINLSKAKMIIFDIDGQFMKLNNLGFDETTQKPNLMSHKYRRTIMNFEAYITRAKALKSRLVAVMDEVRTYLSLQQQKLGMEEQKSSKEQLVRLVNLQEIFHKVEIFIVAVYITEMAHIVFEVLSHDRASLYTAISIPFALLLAIIVSRLLHKE